MSNDVFPAEVRGLDRNTTKAMKFSTIVQEAPSGNSIRIAQAQNPIWRFWLTYNYLKDRATDIPIGLTYTDLRTMMGFVLAHQGQFNDWLYDDPTDDFVGPSMLGSVPNLQAELQIISDTTNPVSAATVASGGSGFAPGDWLSVTGGGGTGAVLQVATVSTGVITSFTIIYGGSGYTTTSGAALTVLTGSGTGSPTANITAVTIWYSPIQRNMGGQFFEDITDLNGGIQVYANGVAQTSPTDYSVQGPGLSFPGWSSIGLYLLWTAQPTGPITVQFNFYFRVRFDMDEREFDQWLSDVWAIGGSEETNSTYLTFVTARPPTA